MYCNVFIRHGSSATFETKSSYCRVKRQSLPCYTAVARLGVKSRATAVLKSNLIRLNLVWHSSSSTVETGLRQPVSFFNRSRLRTVGAATVVTLLFTSTELMLFVGSKVF